MHSVYAKIADSDIDLIHKQLAHDQLTKVYSALQKTRTRTPHATTHIVAAALLLMFFSFLVFFRPSLVGLTSLVSAQQTITQELNIAFVENGSRAISLNKIPLSLSISGKLHGDGSARVYARTHEGRVLVFDSERARISPDGTFSKACANSCTLNTNSKDLILDVQLQNAALTIYTLEYGASLPNTPPQWNGPTKFNLVNGQATIDLATHFFDPDGDALQFLATSTKDLSVTVTGSKARIVALRPSTENSVTGGMTAVLAPPDKSARMITLIASDGKEVTKVDVTIQV